MRRLKAAIQEIRNGREEHDPDVQGFANFDEEPSVRRHAEQGRVATNGYQAQTLGDVAEQNTHRQEFFELTEVEPILPEVQPAPAAEPAMPAEQPQLALPALANLRRPPRRHEKPLARVVWENRRREYVDAQEREILLRLGLSLDTILEIQRGRNSPRPR